ncbi:MAG: hypothetical protein R3D57_09635 [Hyphomicrobiaceae bacterium]
MLRHVVGDLYQVGESVAGSDSWHEAVRVYVLFNDGCPLVFDAGSHLHRAPIMSDLKELLNGAAPGYIFLTHTELPHTGNLSAILAEWPDVKIVVSSSILPYSELPWWVRIEQVKYARAGRTEVYGGRPIAALDGILKDQPGTQWMFDERTGALFTADAFGYLHPESAATTFDDELDDGIPVDWLRRYHEGAFRFLPMVSADKVNADIAKVFATRHVRVIAPTHGNAIRGNVGQGVARLRQAIQEIC